MKKNPTDKPNAGYGQIFLQRESIGGLVLIFVTILALIIANSGWSEHYFSILKKEFALSFDENYELKLSVKHWINDGLMVIFFIVAGLELKREIMVGQLSTWKKAATPLIAALGGMIVPALLYVFVNKGAESAHGWGIPMATDIAYSLGILSLLGRRVPIELKIFLTALAIADDIGAILVIAIFYSSTINWHVLGISAAILTVLFLMNYMGVKRLTFYVLLGIPFWISFLYSGIHPTIAGVLFALSIPIRPVLDSQTLSDNASRHVNTITNKETEQHILEEETQRNALKGVQHVVKNTIPPLFRLEISLSGFNAFVVLPLFALVNAGVVLSMGIGEIIGESVGLGILLGLAVGKVAGITLFSFLSTRLGISTLPPSLTWRDVIGIGLIAGIGFTMSLFITNLAFEKHEFTQIAKISILLASLISAVAGVVVLATSKRNKASSEPEMY